VVGVDISSGALSVARMNTQRLGLEVEWLEGDLLEGVSADAVLANLPYVADDELLPPDVAAYEPRLALLGGPDGLDVVRRLIEQAGRAPRVRLIALEIGHTQAQATAALLERASFAQLERLADLAGLERVVVGRR
jgi:release factor glutamine methyltransferase